MTERPLGCYVYCVIRAGDRPQLEGVSGVDRGHEIQLLTHGDLVAVISQVSLEEFSSEALKRNLEDLAWLERTALAHNAVLAAARGCDAVVPFRTCTIYDDEAHVREMLERERRYFLETLQRLSGRDEWSVKMLADRQRLEAAVRARRPATAPVGSGAVKEPNTPGRDFFARKKVDRSISDEASTLAQTAARSAHLQLQDNAAAARLLPAQNPRLSGRSGEMILNAAYLVDRSAAGEFGSIIDRLRDRDNPDGVELIISGPFAPYNFVGAPEEP